MKNVSVTPGVIVERVGDDLMVIIPGNTDVVSLSGRVADILLDVKAGKTVDSNDPAVHDLITLGVLTAPGMSRRGLITAGAIGAGAGIAIMAMPAAAAALSGPGDEDDDDDDEVAGGFQPTGDEVPLAGFQWFRVNAGGSGDPNGDFYFFGVFPDFQEEPAKSAPGDAVLTFLFKGFDFEASDDTPASQRGGGEAVVAFVDLPSDLVAKLAEIRGTAPDNFFYVRWADSVYVLNGGRWFD